LHNNAVGDAAHKLRHQLLFQTGNLLAASNNELAIQLWQRSDVPTAFEKWIRITHKNGDRDHLKRQLEELQTQSLLPVNRIFIEDFYARKYLGKRTSVYTDMLRENSSLVDIDEAFINHVEDGVIQYYKRNGAECYFVENNFWRGLFALTFWELLYGEHQKQYNEFDRIPQQLSKGTFFDDNCDAIERCLLIFDSPKLAQKSFLALLGRHYGYPTGIFNWQSSFVEALATFLRLGDPSSIKDSLRTMAKDYMNHKDGYPDLMVAENQKLRFEEVKAPGDSLRENQLVCINRLRVCGFKIDLVQVNWCVDPDQIYAVVDIETTGGKRGLHAITEIAIVKILNGKIIDRWSTLVNPQARIPFHITRLTGIDNRMVESAPIFSEVAEQLMERLNDTIFVAHNVGFDYGFIQAAFEQIGQTFRLPKYCTVKNTRKTFPGLKSYALGNLVNHFDIDMKRAHRALDDAKATAELLLIIQAKNSAKSRQA
jgi:DNA polymerase-3 subunit epsilon